MISALAYVPRPTPLGRTGALAATIYIGGFVAVAFVSSNPIVLAGDAAAVAIAGLLAGAGRAMGQSLRWSLVLGVIVIAGNAIASQRGATIWLRGPDLPLTGPIDVSAEAVAEGAVLALRIAIVIAAFAVHTSAVDPDRLLRLLRPIARRSALTATLIVRMVPLAAADQLRLREAAALRGPAARPVGRLALAHRLVSGSLDRAVDIAATLELRGYSRGVPSRARGGPATRGDIGFALSGLAAIGLVIAASIAGHFGFEAYPRTVVDHDAMTFAAAALLPLLAALPCLPGSLTAARWRTDRRRRDA